jgi:hypothetical protein
MPSDSWFYRLSDLRPRGPVSADEIAAMRHLGLLDWNSEVCALGGDGSWIALESVWAGHFARNPESSVIERVARDHGLPLSVTPPPPAEVRVPGDSLVVPSDEVMNDARHLLGSIPSSRPPARVARPKVHSQPPAQSMGSPNKKTGRSPANGTSPKATPRPTPVPPAAPTSSASTPSPVPSQPHKRFTGAVLAGLLLVSGGGGYAWWTLAQGRKATDPFPGALVALVAASTTASWPVLKDYSVMVEQFPAHRSELLSHLTNYLNMAATRLSLPAPEFLGCTNALVAAAEADCIGATRLLAKGLEWSGLKAQQEFWNERLLGAARFHWEILRQAPAVTNLDFAVSELNRFGEEWPEARELVTQEGCDLLASLSQQDLPTDVFQRSQPWLRRMATNGCAEAARVVADHVLPVDAAEAGRFYAIAAARGDGHAQYQLGNIEARGLVGSGPDWTRAFQWYERAAGTGNFEAKVELANLLLSTNELPVPDRRVRQQRGIGLLQFACNLSDGTLVTRSELTTHVRALERLGRILVFEQYEQTGRNQEGAALLQRALSHGSEAACYPLGIHYAGIPFPGRSSYSGTNFARGVEYLEQGSRTASREIRERCLSALAGVFRSSDAARSRKYAEQLQAL